MTLIKSVLVKRPAKVDVDESHNGADTIAMQHPSVFSSRRHKCGRNSRNRTVLHQDVQAGSNGEVIVEHDESEGQRQDIVAGSNFEELAYGRLVRGSISQTPSTHSFTVFCVLLRPLPQCIPRSERWLAPIGTPHPYARCTAHRQAMQIDRGFANVGLAAGEAGR